MQDKHIVNNIDVEDCMHYKCREEVDLCWLNSDWSRTTNEVPRVEVSQVNECHCYGDICERHPDCYYKRYKTLEDILKKLKPILELYANSTMGVEQEDGIYTIDCKPMDMLSGYMKPQDYTVKLTYDSNPAKRGLKLIGDTLDE